MTGRGVRGVGSGGGSFSGRGGVGRGSAGNISTDRSDAGGNKPGEDFEPSRENNRGRGSGNGSFGGRGNGGRGSSTFSTDRSDAGGNRPGEDFEPSRENNRGRGSGNGSFGGRGSGGRGFGTLASERNDDWDNRPGEDFEPSRENKRGRGLGSGSFGGRGSGSRGSGTFSSNRNDAGGNRYGENRDSGRENNRSFVGSFFGGEQRTKFATDEERARAESYIPTTRSIEAIFGDDLKVKDNYLDIRDDDDDVEITGTNSGECQQTLDNWKEAGFEEQLVKNIERSGYTLPRKIQSRTIPLIMDGHDIKGHAETGSGKSAAFLLPIINTIMVKKKKGEFTSKRICPYVLIIEPTREMVIQLYEQALKLADGCDVSVSRTYGKYKFRENLKEISTKGCDILIGTLGRFMHMLKDELILLEQMKVLVLDEADQLLEDESARDLRQIAKTDGWPKVEDRQTLLFSATFPAEVQKWADDWVKPTAFFVSNKKPVSANVKVVQKFIRVSRSSKNHELLKLFEQERAELKAEKPDEPEPKIRPTMLFVKMKRTADVISTYLNLNKVPSTTINGDRPQKLRHAALDDFRAGRYQVVVTTDVCARGIDLKELDHVINMDLPIDYTTYVHRIGRTGRIKEGASTSFFDLAEDGELAKELVEGLQKQEQEVPDWLKMVAEGKMPPDESEAASGANAVPIGVPAPQDF